MEVLDDQLYACYRCRNSVNGDRNSRTRPSSYPSARRIRFLPSLRVFGSRNCITSAARGNCRSRKSRRDGTRTAGSFMDGRKRNHDQTLVSAVRPSPAARNRSSRINAGNSANPGSRRRGCRPQDQKRLPRLLSVANLHRSTRSHAAPQGADQSL
jgi:hypothetical protein